MKVILRGGPCDGQNVQLGPRTFQLTEEFIRRRTDTGAVQVHLRHIYADKGRKEGRFKVFDFQETMDANAAALKAMTAKRRAVDVAVHCITLNSAAELLTSSSEGHWTLAERHDVQEELKKILKAIRKMAELPM
jgi:hypothetical protein